MWWIGIGAVALLLLLPSVASADKHCRKVKRHRKAVFTLKKDSQLKEGPKPHYKTKQLLKRGAKVRIVRVRGRAAKVRTAGIVGWLRCKVLRRTRTRTRKKFVPPAPRPAPPPKPAPTLPPSEPPASAEIPPEPKIKPPAPAPTPPPPVPEEKPAAPPAPVAKVAPPQRPKPLPLAVLDPAPATRVPSSSVDAAGRTATVRGASPAPGVERRFQLGAAMHAGALLLSPMLVEPSHNRYFDPGTLYPGVSVQVGYDLGPKLSFLGSDLWLRANVGLLFNLGEALDTMLLDIQVMLQKRFSLTGRLGLSLGVGPSFCVAMLSLHRVEGTSEGDLASAFTVGLAGVVGLDMAVTPGLRLFLSLMWRQHFVSVEEYAVSGGTWRPGGAWEGDSFSTTYSGLSAGLGAAWVF